MSTRARVCVVCVLALTTHRKRFTKPYKKIKYLLTILFYSLFYRTSIVILIGDFERNGDLEGDVYYIKYSLDAFTNLIRLLERDMP